MSEGLVMQIERQAAVIESLRAELAEVRAHRDNMENLLRTERITQENRLRDTWVALDRAEAAEARVVELEKRNAHLEASTESACVDLKEWLIRFPHTDPSIARRMVEDRAKAEQAAGESGGEG